MEISAIFEIFDAAAIDDRNPTESMKNFLPYASDEKLRILHIFWSALTY